MKSLDVRTQAWLDDMFLYCGANVYGPDKLKEELAWSGEWAERLRRNFDHVLENRSLTADDYARSTSVSGSGENPCGSRKAAMVVFVMWHIPFSPEN